MGWEFLGLGCRFVAQGIGFGVRIPGIRFAFTDFQAFGRGSGARDCKSDAPRPEFVCPRVALETLPNPKP